MTRYSALMVLLVFFVLTVLLIVAPLGATAVASTPKDTAGLSTFW
jgi:hypothetical protein